MREDLYSETRKHSLILRSLQRAFFSLGATFISTDPMEPERPLPALPSKSLLKGPPPLVYQPPNSPPEYRSNSQESVHASREDSLIDNTLVPSSNPSRRMKDTSTKTVEQKGEHSEHRQAHKAFRKFAYAIRVRENDTKTSGGNHTREHDHRHKAADFTSQDFSEHRESKPDVQETKKDLQEKEGIRHSLRSSEALSESQTSSDDLRKSRFAINAETPEALIGKLQLTNHNSFELITSLEAETDNLRQSVEEHKKLVEMKEDEIRKLKASIVDVRRKPAIHVESSRDEIKAEKEEEHAVVIDKLKHEKMFLAKTATIAKSKLQDNVKTMEIIAARYSKSEKELTNKMMDTKRELDMEREHSRKLEEMLQSHKETMESSKAKRAVLEEENAARARQHLQRQKKLLAELDEMREECKKAESNRKENEFRFRSQMNELIANHDDVLGKMQADFNASRAQLEARTSKEFEIEKISHLKEMDRSNEQIDKLKLTFELEKTSITEGTRQAYEDLRNLKRSSEVGKGSLLAELDGCYSALMEKDNFEPMPDREVHAKFFDLANDIEQLARLEWGKEHIKTSWFTQEFVSPVTPQRLVQKQLLQNVIWSILNKHIFGSPFRMFGDEGRKLEINWLQQSGTGQ